MRLIFRIRRPRKRGKRIVDEKRSADLCEMLNRIYLSQTPYTLKRILVNYKTRLGCYNRSLKRLNIYGINCDDVDTAIHEYAHHLQYTDFQFKESRPHGAEFCGIYRALINKALAIGINVKYRSRWYDAKHIDISLD